MVSVIIRPSRARLDPGAHNELLWDSEVSLHIARSRPIASRVRCFSMNHVLILQGHQETHKLENMPLDINAEQTGTLFYYYRNIILLSVVELNKCLI